MMNHMAGGRPSEYDPTFTQKVDEYLAQRVDKGVTIVSEKDNADGSKTLVEMRKGLKVQLPTIEGFALFVGASKKSLYNWADEHEEFLHALDKIRTEQQERLINMGLSGDYNPVIAKLVLSANHGMREKSDVTSDEKGIADSLVTLIKHATTDKGTDAEVPK